MRFLATAPIAIISIFGWMLGGLALGTGYVAMEDTTQMLAATCLFFFTLLELFIVADMQEFVRRARQGYSALRPNAFRCWAYGLIQFRLDRRYGAVFLDVRLPWTQWREVSASCGDDRELDSATSGMIRIAKHVYKVAAEYSGQRANAKTTLIDRQPL